MRRSTLLKDYDDHISKKWAAFLKNHQFNFNYKVQRLLWFSGLIVTLAIAIYLLTQFQTKNGTIAFVILIIVVGVAFYLKRVATRNYDDHVRQYFHSLYADI
ncbi:hypothetical protein ACNAN0_12085 [Agrilactobacillus fermenti]|uniref:hypothetical protein n=1 Tax=Agrilactobacillus fermenti TaxID=2586909 RepID=UPI001E5C9647|nr:hypothetical protein [Agrilactobacillus fermenti]MCD2256974.1 hypothetical protein [Agrilactobacillus fermenti]